MLLNVYINEDQIGQIEKQGKALKFTYEPSWRNAPDAHPLSYSMSLAGTTYTDKVVENFLWGLLPDNDRILRSWAKRFSVSHSDPLALLSHVGEDCAGAVRFVAPTVERLSGRSATAGHVQWLTDEDLCTRIEELIVRGGDGRHYDDAGHFSLAGAQYKTALRWDAEGQRWGIPSGLEPTTDILKPVLTGFDHQAWNEHFCLLLAKAAKIPSAESRVVDICGNQVLVVSRYDRYEQDGRLTRVHQEDACQALGIHPSAKYERDGGPGVKEVSSIIDASATADADRERFYRALVLNVLIGGTDAHAKNYSFLWDRGPTMVLAPLYDINSLWPYTRPHGKDFDRQRIRTAMRMDSKYHIHQMQLRNMLKTGAQLGYAKAKCLQILHDMLDSLPSAVDELASQLISQGCPEEFADRLREPIQEEILRCQSWLSTAG